MLDEQHPSLPQHPHDMNNYILGRIEANKIVIACLPAGVAGTVSAAAVAIRMLSTFKKLRFCVLVGAGEGLPSEKNDIRLGDIIVSEPGRTFGGVIKYNYDTTSHKFIATESLNRPPDVLLTALSTLKARKLLNRLDLGKHITKMINQFPKLSETFSHPGIQHDILYSANSEHPDESCMHCEAGEAIYRKPRKSDEPVVHYGLIASGSQVIRNGLTREQLKKELDVLSIEREAAGLMDNFPCLVIRGICGYSDAHRTNLKIWENYAAAVAAAYAKELLSIIPGEDITNEVCELYVFDDYPNNVIF